MHYFSDLFDKVL